MRTLFSTYIMVTGIRIETIPIRIYEFKYQTPNYTSSRCVEGAFVISAEVFRNLEQVFPSLFFFVILISVLLGETTVNITSIHNNNLSKIHSNIFLTIYIKK